MLARTPIQIPPGVFRRGSEAEMSGRWYDVNLVRWVESVMRPIGGWEKILFQGLTATASTIRAMHQWTDQEGVLRTALLCDGHLYVLESNALIDISPTPAIVAPATDLTEGGYGDAAYSYGTYGTPRPEQIARKLVGPAFTLDNWGEDLLAMVSTDGRLLRWKPSDPPGSKAEAVTNAPISNRTFVVTPERHVMLMQMGGEFAQFGWCDQEDIEDWVFADVNSMAGFYAIEPGEPIVAAKASRFGVCIFTPTRLYLARYLGLPYVYSFDMIGRQSTPLTAQAVVVLADTVVWPATDGFWQFNGSTIAPVDCDVLDWVQTTINQRFATARTAGMFLGSQTEAWWFFPSGSSQIADRYVVWNYQEQWWTFGHMTRTCGVPGSTLSYPFMSDGHNVFRHEYGLFYYDAPLLPFAQTAAINIAKGDRQSTMTRPIVDTRAPADDVEFFFGVRKNRIMNGTPPIRMKGPYNVRADGKLDVRVTGRDLVVRIASTRSGVQPWTFGQMLARLAPRGQR